MQRIAILAIGLWQVGQYTPDLPKGAEKYAAETHTQALSKNLPVGGAEFLPRILKVRITDLPDKDWHSSGGVGGIDGVVSDKYRSGGKAVQSWGPVTMTNGLLDSTGAPATQVEFGVVRTYPDGARFDDVLSYKGVVFEHRVREKVGGKWASSVAYKDPAARPPGYAGLKVSCASCHDRAGTGGYAAGLVPGGDTVFSDPLDWAVIPKGVLTK